MLPRLPPHDVRLLAQQYLSARLLDAFDLQVSSARLLACGRRRETWSLDCCWIEANGKARAQGLVLRLAAATSPNSLTAEASVLRALTDSHVPVPRLLNFEEDERWFGTPALLSDRIDGYGAGSTIRAEDAHELAEHLAELLGALHRMEVAELIHEPTDDRVAASSRGAARKPTPRHLSLVHGNVGAEHLLHRRGRVRALLGWSHCHVGDPMEDLAWWLTHDEPWLAGINLKDIRLGWEEASGWEWDDESFAWWSAAARAERDSR